jgi:DNA-binding transcriptional MerR regulator
LNRSTTLDVTSPAIPDKFYFKIGEVSELLGVKPYVVRFWETEFNLATAKNRSSHRIYKRHEVEILLEIRQMLHVERFTIEGARLQLKDRMKEKQRQLALDLKENPHKSALRLVKKELVAIKSILDRR